MANRAGFWSDGRGPGQVPDITTRRSFFGDDAALIATGDVFTVTTVNCTPALNNIGGRPAIQLAGAGAGTDAYQAQALGDCIRPQAGKAVRMCGWFRTADLLHDFSMGMAVTDTTVIASDPTDHFMIQKLSAVSVFTCRARKASGTVETFTCGAMNALIVDRWYFYELVAIRDLSTAGRGKINVYLSDPDPAAGAQSTLIGSNTIATQFPDTVDLAPFQAWRAGSTVTTLGHFGGIGWEQEL